MCLSRLRIQVDERGCNSHQVAPPDRSSLTPMTHPMWRAPNRSAVGDFRGVIETTDETECIPRRTGSIPSRLTTARVRQIPAYSPRTPKSKPDIEPDLQSSRCADDRVPPACALHSKSAAGVSGRGEDARQGLDRDIAPDTYHAPTTRESIRQSLGTSPSSRSRFIGNRFIRAGLAAAGLSQRPDETTPASSTTSASPSPSATKMDRPSDDHARRRAMKVARRPKSVSW
jgi:hypothetical protein